MGKVLLPFRYAGGKYYALKIIQPFLDRIKYDEYREPFFGGGAVFWANEKVEYNWINDLYEDLIFFLKIMRDEEKRNQLIDMFKDEKEATKEHYEIVKNMAPKNDIERAYQFYYLNRTSFSGKMKTPSWGYRPKRSLPPYRWSERLVPCGEKLSDVKITNLDFEEIIKAPAKGKTVMMFIDPPYYNVDSKNHYVCGMDEADHKRLCRILKETKHNFVLTYDDCKDVREMYDWAYIYDLNFYYRIGNARDTKNQREIGMELIITNFDMEGNDGKAE